MSALLDHFLDKNSCKTFSFPIFSFRFSIKIVSQPLMFGHYCSPRHSNRWTFTYYFMRRTLNSNLIVFWCFFSLKVVAKISPYWRVFNTIYWQVGIGLLFGPPCGFILSLSKHYFCIRLHASLPTKCFHFWNVGLTPGVIISLRLFCKRKHTAMPQNGTRYTDNRSLKTEHKIDQISNTKPSRCQLQKRENSPGGKLVQRKMSWSLQHCIFRC